MDWIEYLQKRRADYLSQIACIEGGRLWTGEMRDGQRVDTTAESLARCKENLAEIEQILTDNGAPLDA